MMRATLVGLLLLSCQHTTSKPQTLPSEGTLPAKGEEAPIEPNAYQAMLGRGLDVDWIKTRAGQREYDASVVRAFREMGITHVRLRVTEATQADDLSRLLTVIDDCLRGGLIPVIAYQADFFKNDPSAENIEKVAAWWRSVAEALAKHSRKISFDILIEATDALNDQPEALNKLYERAVAEIRSVDATRLVLISPRLRSDPAYLKELKIPSKANGYLLAEWHFYASGPSRSNPRKQWTTGTDSEKKLITDAIQTALKWQEETKIPTWVGAWMPGIYAEKSEGDAGYTTDEEIAFARFMTCELTRVKIPFAVNAGHHFYDAQSSSWITEKLPVLKAILETTCAP
jgi:hypothetical protein